MTTANSTTTATPRRGFQFRIVALLIAMVWVGLISLGLRTPTPILSGIVNWLTFLTTLTSILIAIYRPNRSRAMAVGFSLFCGVYLLSSSTFLGFSVWPNNVLITELFNLLAKAIHGNRILTELPTVNVPSVSVLTPTPYQLNDFLSICHHSMATLLGLIGSIIAQVLYATRPLESSEQG